MAKKIKSKAPKEKIEQYIAVVEAIGWEWKGAANMYTSHNGHMFSYLSPAGEVAVRLPKDEREAFMEKYNTELSVQYNTVMKEYPVVPSDLLERTEELVPHFEKSLAYVTSLKPKPTTKKKQAHFSMKTGINMLLLFAVAFLTKASNGPPDGTMKELSWLVGKWERTDVKNGETAYEEWWIEEGDLVGKGVTIQDGKTTFVEHLRIEKADDEWYYVAEVSHNDAPTWFRITEITDHAFVCSNPEHDFPKKIAYVLSGDQLTVTISDEAKGFDFLFKRS